MAREPLYLDNEVFPNGWTVIERASSMGTGASMWRARHTCGNERAARADQLRNGLFCPACGTRKIRPSMPESEKPKRRREFKGGTIAEQAALMREALKKIDKKTGMFREG